jgi:GNAT superfamily N-acetyltransferase
LDADLEAPGAGIAPLFASHRTLRAIVEAGVEGRQGTVARDGDAARLSLGCYHVFGGDPASAGARRLLESAAGPRELIYGNDAAWRALILDVFGDRVFDRPMEEFDPCGLDDAALAAVEASLPPDFTLRRLDTDLAAQLDRELEPHGLQVFASPRQLADEGLGVAIVHGDRLACAATSYTRSSRYVEVAIATHPDFRGRGLAAVAAAALVRECLRRGLEPCWSASNPVSKRLAERLGYRPAAECEVLFLVPPFQRRSP